MIDAALEQWRSASQAAGDMLLGPLLAFSIDATLIVLVILTIAVLLAVRRLTINQSMLHAAAGDMRTLKQLMKQTPGSEQAARRRYRRTRARVARARLAMELPGALLSLLILTSILSWAWNRLAFRAPRPGDTFVLSVFLPASKVGQFVHIVPDEQIQATPGLVRVARLVSVNNRPRGRADWLVTFKTPGIHAIKLRSGTTTMRHVLRAAGPFYSPPLQRHADDCKTRATLKPYRPLGFIPGLPWIALPPWFVAYLVLVIAGFHGVRRALRWR